MSERSPEWEAWKEATFGTGYMIWHDGLPVDAVTGLRGAARDDAVRMLRIGLSTGDGHAAEALAAMGETSAVDGLRAGLVHPEPGERVRIALALNALAPDPALAEVLAEVLRTAPTWSARIDAAIGLRHFPADVVAELLLHALAHDPEYLVRYHAAESFLAVRRLAPRDISKHPAVFEALRVDDPTAWPRASERLRSLG